MERGTASTRTHMKTVTEHPSIGRYSIGSEVGLNGASERLLSGR